MICQVLKASFLFLSIAYASTLLLPDFRNTSLSHEVRVNDLLSRLSEYELIDQLTHGGAGPKHGPAPAIRHLDIGPYQWRSECLHGYSSDSASTSFPQVISQSASFDVEMVYNVAKATALEARAKYNNFTQKGEYEDHKGINCFSPVVNIMRSPIWGRNQETMGEDPYLSGVLAEAFVRGLSGLPLIGDPPEKHVLLTSATCKHFAVHDGPEDYPVSRLSFEAYPSNYSLWSTYLPAFRACIGAGAQSVMCSYNGINGLPACANHWLLTDLLRKQWNFTGFVISDEGALQFMVSHHKAFNDYMEAAYAAVKAGVNIENAIPNQEGVYSRLELLFTSGILHRSDFETLARPLFLTRMRQAEFDPPFMNPYRDLDPDKLVQSESHRLLSLIAGCKSTVLLKNDDGFLPIKLINDTKTRRISKLHRLGLIGPFVKSMAELIGSYAAFRMPEYEITIEQGLSGFADETVVCEYCMGGAACDKYNETCLDTVFTGKKLDLLIVTVGTGCELEKEGHDKHDLHLPGKQNRIISIIRQSAFDTPVVLFVYSASPVDIGWALEMKEVKSILWFGFPGQKAGEIAARILFESSLRPDPGKQTNESFWWSPAGRLPFTWYRSLDNLASITDYEMTNQTYRFGGPVVCGPTRANDCIHVTFPFGYGLTYTRDHSGANGFVYTDLRLPSYNFSSSQGVPFTVKVRNRGTMASDEVVQVYIDWLNLFGHPMESNFDGLYKTAFRQLTNFERIPLLPGMERELAFYIAPNQLAVWRLDDTRPPIGQPGGPIAGQGVLRLSIGGQQPNQEMSVGSNTLQKDITIRG